MKICNLQINLRGVPLSISATSGRGLLGSCLNLLCFATVAIKKHKHHRTTISSFLFCILSQDLSTLDRPSAHKSFQKKNSASRNYFYQFTKILFCKPIGLLSLAEQIAVIVADQRKSELRGIL
ncbi:uncharacterized protein METZ01_LOCUS223930 [marine metagenome]|uniref:Uncharacterized protein n=1 Tax=marine metagenome TaxID=408172 RepID=A0A382G726_9ZZZZ